MSIDQRGEDRLPWLEPVDDYGDEDPVSIVRLVGSVLIGLVLLGLVIGGIFWYRNHRTGDGNGALIAAPAGPIKERPEDAGGMDVEGTGDVAYGASVGEAINSVIDPRRAPETPVTESLPSPVRAGTAAEVAVADAKPKPAPAPAPAEVKPVPEKAASASKPVPQPVKGRGGVMIDLDSVQVSSSSGASLLQLGAYSSPALARQAWTKLSSRFPPLGQGVYQLSATTIEGKTLHRLRARVSNGGTALCARIKSAGEACSVLE